TFNGSAVRKAQEFAMPHPRIRFVGQGPDGAIYLLEDGDGARLLRLTPAR
ncbi:MAG TPA: PQQ-dependent sugar dehydrogenase, partial [Sphingomicrobium sp.]|nr:PQQ-dependent sugar dehydrogenase [Sphingomicrobium sp.]